MVGSIVGSYSELAELMALAQAGKVTLHTRTYPLADAPMRWPTWTRGGSGAARSSSPAPARKENHG